MNSVNERPVEPPLARGEITQEEARQIVGRYFERFNQKAFEQVGALFRAEGELHPPFEAPIIGARAIEAYLQRKAISMRAEPQHWSVQAARPGQDTSQKASGWLVEVTGEVEAVVFRVATAWRFEVAPEGKLAWVAVKLLASPQELLGLRQARAAQESVGIPESN